MAVFAFDRDWTVDVNPHPHHEAVPLEWVHHLAHETDHVVYAIGNQTLVEEAAIPGVVDIVGRHPDDWGRWLGDKQPNGRYERFPTRSERLSLIADLHPEADDYIVVDDFDLSDVKGWDHYHAWEFVPAVERGDVRVELPPSDEPVKDGGFQAMVDRIQSDSSFDKIEDSPTDESGTPQLDSESSESQIKFSRSIVLHPEIDRIFEVLRARHRRMILLLLRRGVVETESDVIEQVDGEMKEVALIHTHLPKLANADYIEWNRTTGELSKGPCFDEVDPFIDLIESYADELHGIGPEGMLNG